MAKFCPNCGKPIDAGALFCDNCGTRLTPQPSVQPEQAPTQSYGDPYMQSPRPTQPPQQQYIPYQQPNQPFPQYGAPQYGAPQPPKKKKTGLIIGLCIAGAVLIACIVIVVIVLTSVINPHKDNPLPTIPQEVTEQAAETAAEAMTEKPTEEPAEEPTEPPTEAPTEAPTEPPVDLPYVNSLGKINATDFAWISDAMSGGLQGKFLSNDDLLGKWKGEFIFDGIWELVYVTIASDGTITVQPDKINYGEGWEDESGDPSYTFSGAFDVNRVYGSGQYGSIDLYQFLKSGSSEYAVGELKTNSGKAGVYLVRP